MYALTEDNHVPPNNDEGDNTEEEDDNKNERRMHPQSVFASRQGTVSTNALSQSTTADHNELKVLYEI